MGKNSSFLFALDRFYLVDHIFRVFNHVSANGNPCLDEPSEKPLLRPADVAAQLGDELLADPELMGDSSLYKKVPSPLA